MSWANFLYGLKRVTVHESVYIRMNSLLSARVSPFSPEGPSAVTLSREAALSPAVDSRSQSKQKISGSVLGLIGACSYIGSVAISFRSVLDFPLIVLALTSVLATLTSVPKGPSLRSPIVFSTLLFLGATGLSILASENVIHSVLLSASLLPALLLFFLIVNYFDGVQAMRALCFTFSLVALGLAVALIWVACTSSQTEPEGWIATLASPMLVVKNDVTFLSILAPLSLALVYRELRSVVGVTAALSLLLSIGVVGMYQSRVAMVTMIASIACTASVLRPRLGLACGLVSLFLVLLIDSILGFPLITKFFIRWEGSGRLSLWLAALTSFLDAPVVGHGPHTFVYYYREYLQQLHLPAWLNTDTRIVPWAHNLYLEFLSEQGAFGVATLILLLARGTSHAWELQHTASREVRIIGAAALGGLVGFSTAGFLELSFLRHWVVITMFVLLGLITRLSFTQTNLE